ncbi:DNA/RNA non-specific endonuclease [Mucilaginibacter myungsuensis]|uniref:DNA/RNA non-specific endonuclease n=1 Tax=Mucilaginibacter myungsuensis TaxID=649104 RepID=A0A929L0P9_9SPHI|nr:DNA/RNA non-specific endonuclease [Mucilaginibacter myungsuensis]MBE9661141.1 DNA/RNA non-specific endonuclease [Mucilaginibacter myungsuensis]MDN3597286.1 DNA/RNA non-specific endonuclease [Mucilaginibacter myungsuensis]
MKKTLLITFAAMAFLVTGCKKNTDEMITPVTPPVVNPPAVPKDYALNENFESGVKQGYDAGNLVLATGSWNIDGGLLGSDPNDTKNGSKSIRLQGTPANPLRVGTLTMNFDIKHLTSFSVKAALTNFSDKARGANATLKGYFEVQISTDAGKTFKKIGQTVNCDTVLKATKYTITDSVVRFRIINTSDMNGSNKVRINIDDIEFAGKGDPGITVGTPEAPTDPDPGTGAPAATPRPAVTTGTDVPPTTGDNSNLLMGNPSNAQASIATSDNYLIDMGYYTESYNATKGTPNWVSWHLDNSNTTNATGRLDNFAAWSGLPSTFFAVQSNSYSGSGFDRGHNCPSADRTSSTAANGATFLMTNMIPQAPNNNQQIWNEFEQYLRLQTLQGNEVYIIMGSYGIGGVGSLSTTTVTTIASGKITVPANVWKVAVIIPAGNGDIIRTGAGTRVIAINTPNLNSVTGKDWAKYIVTVRSIEQATGYNLLSSLPQSVQDAIETGKDSGI